MLKAIIIDDEEKARVNLQNLLEEFCPNVRVVGSIGELKDFKQIEISEAIDLVFLDIEMKGESGFDLLEQFEDDIDFEIIFVTAHHEYAIKAFKFSATDYLLKPINIKELVEAVQKVQNKHNKNFTKERLELLVKNLSPRDSKYDKIVLPTLDGLSFVRVNDIIRCESEDNYTAFYFTDGKKNVVSKTIKYFEDMLEEHQFFRIHRSHIINLNYIAKYIKGDGGYVEMTDGSSVIVSRRKKDAFLRIFDAL